MLLAQEWTDLRDEEITLDGIQRTLEPLQDDLWVATACLDRVVDDTTIQRSLLDLGLERTVSAAQRSQASTVVDAESTSLDDALTSHFNQLPADARLCAIRIVLLHRLDRLNTYVEICKLGPGIPAGNEEQGEEDGWEDAWGEPSSPTDVEESTPLTLPQFLLDPLVHSACTLATRQWLSAVKCLFDRHTSFIWAHRLTILQCIPDHVDPSLFRDLLPTTETGNLQEKVSAKTPWRNEADWVENAVVHAVLNGLEMDVLAAEAQEMADSAGTILDVDSLSAWYQERIRNVISSTGMIDIALSLVQHAASQGVPGLDEMGEDLSLLARLVYDAPQGQEEDDWTLDRWHAMDEHAVLCAYLAHSTAETLARDIWRLVMPYLFVLESRAERSGRPDPHIRTRILYDYILSVPLETCATIFEASKPILPAAQRIVQNDEDMARIALACLYGSSSLDEWTTMNRIFECLPAWDIAADAEEDVADMTIASLGAFVVPSTTRPQCTPSDLLLFFQPLPLTSLSRALDILDVHLESGEILSRWSVPAPLRWFLQSSSDVTEQRAWANRMARRAGGSDDKLTSLDDWEWLLEDMLKLTGKGDNGLNGAFGLLTQDEVLRIFLSGLLSTGNFSIARNLLHSPKNKLTLSNEVLEDICLACSHELYDNSSSGNYTFGDMKLAYDCLDVPPPSDRLLREKEFIEATSRLASFNVKSAPIEIRLTKDRLSLVSHVLSSNSEAYKHTEVVLELVHKLGFRDNGVAEVKTLAMLTDTALQAEDFSRAFETSQRMVKTVFSLREAHPNLHSSEVQEASEVCWVTCFQLARHPEFDELDKKLALFGLALELCPADNLHDVLGSWRRLENESIQVREEQLSNGPGNKTKITKRPTNAGVSLRSRLQDFQMPSPALLNTPDAAALASRTFRTVAANFPFGRGRSQFPDHEGERSSSGSRRGGEADEISAQASRVLSKGIGWLIGADED